MKKEVALARLAECGVVAVIRAQSDTQLMDITKALIEGGVIGIEVTMSTPKAIQGIQRLVDALGDKVVVGVGTVLDAGTAASAIHAGAEFVLSPVMDTRVIEVTKRLGKAVIPGAYTPTEILTAWGAGADLVKVYPATTLGPGYFKDLLARNGLNLIVERVEDEKTVVQLLEFNVDFGQGYLFGEPRPIRDVAEANDPRATQPSNVTVLPAGLVRRLAG